MPVTMSNRMILTIEVIAADHIFDNESSKGLEAIRETSDNIKAALTKHLESGFIVPHQTTTQKIRVYKPRAVEPTGRLAKPFDLGKYL